ncbi:hypothetical protein [Engelhardtia mirabilis]|uniref:Uncharacterized protein n=1 Tax=Engelhardtia mirabilis TaxID=2528011 RepID=A0A518BQC7_9BACT|nr:hypothetical protein Pla133_42940 [Planctomycetes bacterium Pla133]QDV03504.1 hypothetical protein Pla86_42930 [Planctomycetes bacterium Pla86]
MFRPSAVVLALFAACPTLQGCAFHSTAREWNGLVGPDGEPTHLRSSTNVGLNLFVVFTIFGSTDTGGMVDEITGEIAAEGGDRVRIIQSASENYWYGFPPLTWILTPVVTTVAADYVPANEVPESEPAENPVARDDDGDDE